MWIAGQAGTDLPGQAAGRDQGRLPRQLDVATGAIDWSRRFTGKDSMAAPTAIAVDPTGSSVLDRLGLPTGALRPVATPAALTAQSSLRAGDQFTVQRRRRPRPDDHHRRRRDAQTRWPPKIQRAAGFQATVTVNTVDGTAEPAHRAGQSADDDPVRRRDHRQERPGAAGHAGGRGPLHHVNADGQPVPGDGKSQIYGLGLDSNLNLGNAAQISHAQAQIAAAIGRGPHAPTRTWSTAAHAEERRAARQAAAKRQRAGAAISDQPDRQLYQAALARLTGGG